VTARISWEVRGGTSGAGEAVLLVPPLGRGRASWSNQLPALLDAHRCVLFDPRGIGESKDAGPGPLSAATLAEDAVAALDAAGVERAHVVGWSLGAAAATLVALDHPERVTSLSLLTPWARTDAHLATAFRVLRDLVEHAGALSAEVATLWLILSRSAVNAAGAGLVDGAQADCADPGYPSAETMRAYLDGGIAFDVLDRLGTVAVPTLVVGGTDDRLVDVAHAREIAAAVPGARLHVLEGEGASHALPVERAAEVNQLLTAFLAEHTTTDQTTAAHR